MKNFITILLFEFIASQSSYANENDDLIDAFLVAKMTGMCGMIKQLSTFQEATKMPGGDDFIVRFLNTEATRLGYSLPQFLEGCVSSVENYKGMMKALGYEQ